MLFRVFSIFERTSPIRPHLYYTAWDRNNLSLSLLLQFQITRLQLLLTKTMLQGSARGGINLTKNLLTDQELLVFR